MWDYLNNLEIEFLVWLHRCTGNLFADTFMRFVSVLGNKGAVFIVGGLILLIFRKTRKTGFIVLTALLIDLVLVNLILKPMTARIRPYDFAGIVPLISPLEDASFPSGHTAAAFAFAGAVWKSSKFLRYSALVFALLMAFSRMYLFVHFPTDVLVGAFCGILCGITANYIWRRNGTFSERFFKNR